MDWPAGVEPELPIRKFSDMMSGVELGHQIRNFLDMAAGVEPEPLVESLQCTTAGGDIQTRQNTRWPLALNLKVSG